MLNHHDEDSFEEICDHILVRIWLNDESGHDDPDHCLSKAEASALEESYRQLTQEGHIQSKGKEKALTPFGVDRAKDLIRRHRLAERLFAVVFNLSEEAVHAQACRMEHEKVLTQEAVEGICAFLGHPPTCPHGRPIPAGDCCRLFSNEVRPLVMPLNQGEVGEEYKIIFITQKYHSLLERLSGLGVSPGALFHLSQRIPSYLLKVHETEVALDSEVASGIYVVKQNGQVGE